MARQVSLRLAMDDIASASLLVMPLLEVLNDNHTIHKLPLIALEAIKISLARIYIAQEKIEQANYILDDIQTTLESDKRFGRLMETFMLRALATKKQKSENKLHQAIAWLEQALELAEPAGFVLLFLEEGPGLIPLLTAIVDHQAATDPVRNYARKLLFAFGGSGDSAASLSPRRAAELVEQLTSREIEVLLLIAAGDSNQTIAEKLFITVRTVKKHTSNIYGKLSASSRTQAVARECELGLLLTD